MNKIILPVFTLFAISTAIAVPFFTNNTTTSQNVVDFDICTQPNIGLRNRLVDAVTTVADGSTYAFAGPFYWKLGNSVIEPGYPRRISDDWKGLPTGLDTAVTWQNVTYFFKNGIYWRFQNQKPLDSYPAPMSVEFPGIPKAIDAAVVWSGNGQLYFFNGNQFWKFKFDAKTHTASVPVGYPMSIGTNWRGVQQPVEVATQWTNNRTYFFSGNSYSRYHDQNDQVDSGYPMSILKEWFGCAPQSDLGTGAGTKQCKKLLRSFNIAPMVDHGYVNNVGSAEECCQICRAVAETGCKAFVYNGGDGDKKCWLKNVTEPLIEVQNDAVVGFV